MSIPIQILRRVAAECEQEGKAAIETRNWRVALEAKLTGLIWRTNALALDIALVPAFSPKAAPVALARELREHCRRALDQLEQTANRADHFHKVRTIGEVLDGILDVAGVLEAWTGGDSQEPFFLAIAATGLGQADVEIGLVESGHWEQVAHWQEHKPGRGEGWTTNWRKQAAPEIRDWIESEPGIKPTAVVEKLWVWLQLYGKNHKGERLPEKESLRKALDGMHKSGMIKLPWK